MAAAALLTAGLGLLGPLSGAGAAPTKPVSTTTPTTAPRSTTTVKAATGAGTKKAGATASTTAVPTTAKPSTKTTTPASKTPTTTVRTTTTVKGSGSSGTTKATTAPRSTPTTARAPVTTATTSRVAPTTVPGPAIDLVPSERPALLVDGPASVAPASGLDISPLAKIWMMAGGLAAVAVVLTLLVVWYWRRTQPYGRTVMVASAGAIAPRSKPRRHRHHDAPIELDDDVEGVRVIGVSRRVGRPDPSSVVDRRTAATTAATVTSAAGASAAANGAARWTGEVKVTTGAVVTGTLVPLATAPANLDRSTEHAASPRRWTGDRWSDCDPKLRTRV